MFGAILKRWNLVELFVVPLAASLMRASWAYPFIQIALNNFLTERQQIVMPFWLLVALGFCGAMVSHLDRDNSTSWAIAIGGGFVGSLISLLIVFPPQGVGLISWLFDLIRQMLYWNNALPAPLVLFLASVFLWWRGLATEHMSHDALVRAFLTGAGLLILLLLATRLMPTMIAPEQMTSAMLEFIIFGLITLALGGASGGVAAEQHGDRCSCAGQPLLAHSRSGGDQRHPRDWLADQLAHCPRCRAAHALAT